MERGKPEEKGAQQKLKQLIQYLAITGGREKVCTCLFSSVVSFNISADS